ncbi:MAG: helix-turn-helix domain-containing protein [Natronospirillum sp.]
MISLFSSEQYIQHLGLDLRAARKRRKWPVRKVHEALLCSAQTVQRMEKGDPTVAIGRYMAYIQLLGLQMQDLDDSARIRVESLRAGVDPLSGDF